MNGKLIKIDDNSPEIQKKINAIINELLSDFVRLISKKLLELEKEEIKYSKDIVSNVAARSLVGLMRSEVHLIDTINSIISLYQIENNVKVKLSLNVEN